MTAPAMDLVYEPANAATPPEGTCRCGHGLTAHLRGRGRRAACVACEGQCLRYRPHTAATRRLRRALRRLAGR